MATLVPRFSVVGSEDKLTAARESNTLSGQRVWGIKENCNAVHFVDDGDVE